MSQHHLMSKLLLSHSWPLGSAPVSSSTWDCLPRAPALAAVQEKIKRKGIRPHICVWRVLCCLCARQPWTAASQNHRTAWGGRDLKDHEAPTPPLQVGPPMPVSNSRPGCPGPHPTWPCTPPGMDGASTASLGSCSAPHHSHRKELPPDIQPQSSLLQLQTISPCPAVISPFQVLPPLLFVGSL